MVRDWLDEGVDPDAEHNDLTCVQCGEPLQEMTGEERTEVTILVLEDFDEYGSNVVRRAREGWRIERGWIEYRCPQHGYSGGSDPDACTFNVHEASGKRLSPESTLAQIEQVEKDHAER